jgi:metallo-beta-lactamase family protein
MAGSGMCTGGRIKHHLKHNIARPDSTILFVGYQGEGTLGREIVDGAKSVHIFDKQFPVRARIEQISGLSAHGDQHDLLRWLGAFKPPPKNLFLTHGEEQVALKLANKITSEWRWNVNVPAYGEVIELD